MRTLKDALTIHRIHSTALKENRAINKVKHCQNYNDNVK